MAQPLKSIAMLAKDWDGQNIENWLVSRKFDGMRAIWTGTEYISRYGKPIYVPPWFKEGMPPDIKLDGELYIGIDSFQELVSITKCHTPSQRDWSKIKYHVFDVCDSTRFYLDRMSLIKTLPSHCVIVEQTPIHNESEVHLLLDKELDIGGEGLMLRDPYQVWLPKRVNGLLKVKKFFTEDATVVSHTPGTGKHYGRMGAIGVRWKNRLFFIGTGFNDNEREKPPAIGSIVEFRYNLLTNDGIPKNASFLRIRTDAENS